LIYESAPQSDLHVLSILTTISDDYLYGGDTPPLQWHTRKDRRQHIESQTQTRILPSEIQGS
jgi:hypothetical protein